MFFIFLESSRATKSVNLFLVLLNLVINLIVVMSGFRGVDVGYCLSDI